VTQSISLQFDPPVIAHRGASAYAPENTMSAFTRAIQLGINWIEFDVMLAACSTPIVFHDETLERTTNGVGNVGDYPYAYLRTLDAGTWFSPAYSCERIPSLDQVAQFLYHSNIFANVEIKPLPGQDVATVINAVKVFEPYFPELKERALFSSFSLDSLKTLREQMPDCMLGLLIHEWNLDWEAIVLSLNCTSVHIYEDILTQDTANKIKQMGKTLLCYTVNDTDRAEELYSWGVDAVFSDCPDKIARYVY
jgi:glycerophosphoryl diester phosphodiesterase